VAQAQVLLTMRGDTGPVNQTPRLRPIATADIPTVLTLNERDVDLLAPLDASRLAELRALAQRADVIDVEGRVAGFVITFGAGTDYDSPNYQWFTERYGDDFSYLDRIVISSDYRRRGLGRFVYERLESLAQPFGRMALEVNVEPPNEGSLAFHAARGYVEVGRLGEPGHLVSLMVKEL